MVCPESTQPDNRAAFKKDYRDIRVLNDANRVTLAV